MNAKTTKRMFRVICALLTLALTVAAAPSGVSVSVASGDTAGTAGAARTYSGPYGTPNFSYEDYLAAAEIERASGGDLENYYYELPEDVWNRIVAKTHNLRIEIVVENDDGSRVLDWYWMEQFVGYVELEDEKAAEDAAWEAEIAAQEAEREAQEAAEEAEWEALQEEHRAEERRQVEEFMSLPEAERNRRISEAIAEGEARVAANAKAQADAAKAKADAYAAQPITLKVNGTVIKTDSPPVQESGRTLAPLRAVVEALGYIVSWDSATQTIDIYNYYTEALVISMRVGSRVARVAAGSGASSIMTDVTLDVPARTINGRTMVPVRFIAENLGCSVSWDEASKTVSIQQNMG